MNSSKGSKENVSRIRKDYIEEQSIIQERLARRKKGLVRRLTVFTTGIVIFIGFTAYTISNQNAILDEQRVEKNRLEEQLQTLEEEEQELLAEVENLHDPEYIAEIARRDFYLTKPGETLFQLPSTSSD